MYFRDNGLKDKEIKEDIERVDCSNYCVRLLSAQLKRWLVIVDAMLDSGVSELPDVWLTDYIDNQFYQFVSILSRRNPHLKILSVNLRVRYSYCLFVLY